MRTIWRNQKALYKRNLLNRKRKLRNLKDARLVQTNKWLLCPIVHCFVNGVSCWVNSLSVRKDRGNVGRLLLLVPLNGCIYTARRRWLLARSRYHKTLHPHVSSGACSCCCLISPLSSTEHHPCFYSFFKPI